jgi:hypothetical protein
VRLTSEQLIHQLSIVLDPTNARAAIQSYIELQQRFLAGDWKPAELDGGRLCEAVGRCLLQLDQGVVNHRLLPGKIAEALRDKSKPHDLGRQDREHVLKVIEVIYKFRSDRGPVHISPLYTANYMDSMLVIHACKWLLAELLRLAWNQDRTVLAEVIAQLVQLEHSLIHEVDGKPLVLATSISAPEELLMLLYWAPGNRLTRAELRCYAANQRAHNVSTAIARLIREKQIRPTRDDEVALTPNGQRRLIEEILPKLAPKA